MSTIAKMLADPNLDPEDRKELEQYQANAPSAEQEERQRQQADELNAILAPIDRTKRERRRALLDGCGWVADDELPEQPEVEQTPAERLARVERRFVADMAGTERLFRSVGDHCAAEQVASLARRFKAQRRIGRRTRGNLRSRAPRRTATCSGTPRAQATRSSQASGDSPSEPAESEPPHRRPTTTGGVK